MIKIIIRAACYAALAYVIHRQGQMIRLLSAANLTCVSAEISCLTREIEAYSLTKRCVRELEARGEFCVCGDPDEVPLDLR